MWLYGTVLENVVAEIERYEKNPPSDTKWAFGACFIEVFVETRPIYTHVWKTLGVYFHCPPKLPP